MGDLFQGAGSARFLQVIEVTGMRVGQASTTDSKAKLLIYKPKFLVLTVKLLDLIVRTADSAQKMQTLFSLERAMIASP